MIDILHICCNYQGSRTYSLQFNHLDSLGYKQTVYVPVRSNNQAFNNKYTKAKNIKYKYSEILNAFTRTSFRYKSKIIIKDIEKTDPNKYNIIHAHTLFSDGIAALFLHKKYKIPYVVSVRSTDINAFLKFKPYLKNIAGEILYNSSRIIIVAPWIEKKIYQYFFKAWQRKVIKNKIINIPNPINDKWISRSGVEAKKNSEEGIRLIYIGTFIKRKNAKGIKIELKIVGGVGRDNKKVIKMADNFRGLVNFVGQVNNIDKLKMLFAQCNIFIMVSKRETFGMVYAEALSQGIPIVFSRGTGFDGVFKDGLVGNSADPQDLNSIVDAILKTKKQLDLSLFENIEKHSNHFRSEVVSKKLDNVYRSALYTFK